MLVCIECGNIFDEPKRIREKHGFDHGPFEEFTACPKCGGAYTEAHICAGCNEYIIDRYVKTTDEQRWCLDCYRIMELGDED